MSTIIILILHIENTSSVPKITKGSQSSSLIPILVWILIRTHTHKHTQNILIVLIKLGKWFKKTGLRSPTKNFPQFQDSHYSPQNKENSLVAQALRQFTFTAVALGSITGQGTKILQVTWDSQKKKKKERKKILLLYQNLLTLLVLIQMTWLPLHLRHMQSQY